MWPSGGKGVRFRTEQGHCGACGRKWQLTNTDLCPCGEIQTMSHIVESCPLTKLNGGLSRLHSADEDAVLWLTSYGSWNVYEKKITMFITVCWQHYRKWLQTVLKLSEQMSRGSKIIPLNLPGVSTLQWGVGQGLLSQALLVNIISLKCNTCRTTSIITEDWKWRQVQHTFRLSRHHCCNWVNTLLQCF